jgi:hypothetical protein
MNQSQSLQLQQLQQQAQQLKSLNWFSAYVAYAALSVVKGIVTGIKDGFLRRAVLLGFPAGEEFIAVLSDGNPENEAQAAAIWQRFVSEVLPDFAEDELVILVGKIEDPEKKELVLVGGNLVISGLRLFTDKDPDNKAQLKALIKDAIQDKRTTRAVLLFAIELAQDIENEKYRDIIIGLLTGLLENGGIGFKD